MVKIYKQPFAHEGDAIAIPDASQPDGNMSNVDGWTPDYQLPKTDPNYKPVGRQEMNGVFKEVTEALGQVQVQGAASWSADGAPYPANAQVYHNGKQWIALRANSVEPTDGEDWSAIVNTAIAPWISRAVGEEIWLDDSNPAVDVPPTDNPNFRYIKISAGENGIGGYNEGVLINEAVSGSAPLIEATAEINLPDSPLHGQVVRLLNTERRFVRAGDAGVVQNDQMQRIIGQIGRYLNYDDGSGALTSTGPTNLTVGLGDDVGSKSLTFNSANSPNARASDTTNGETRPRNIGRTVYMRIL